MKIAVYNSKAYEQSLFKQLNTTHTLSFITEALAASTVHQACGYDAVCCFVTDDLSKPILEVLAKNGIKLIALRSTGYDHVDMAAANTLGITVVHVPNYSPEAIAEFAIGLILALSRKILTAYLHGIENNFSLDDLMGFNIHGKIVGIIGTGSIGTVFAKIMAGFGCHIIAVDPTPNDTCLALGVNYVSLETLLAQSDIISLHCPLTPQTHHMINADAYTYMKRGAMLINTGRGSLCDAAALIEALQSEKLAYAGLDVYEKEKGLYFIDHHGAAINDPLFLTLRALPNVIMTPHQAFLTQEAVTKIVSITLDNMTAFEQGKSLNQIHT
jgi:D-lactate dehydrogenase